ncbi:hypothetical protein [Stutzerimonas stutzeri]|uniref:hypothetical protein n=1 Tax=Stutzerimonas stutzeri TaxID=316 RepID=UPI0015E3C73F|nr:hypothetical protein [Stutzerimonas stutzeri]MBA1280417.1 hypothetical protein [Stutzerimonas stutzeri]
MKGTLLDDYLKETSDSLSADELDRQLLDAPHPGAKAKTQSKAPSNSAATAKPNTSNSAAEALDAAFDAITLNEEKKTGIDSAVKAASHGVRVLGPLMVAVNRWLDPLSESDQIEKTMGAVLQRLQSDATQVIEAYGLTRHDAPSWLVSQVSGQLMEVLVQAINRNNGTVMQSDDQRYLAPLLNLAKQTENISDSPYAHPNDPKWSLINTLIIATSEVMTEYQNFNYFHSDAAAVAQFVTDFLNERVIEGTLADLTERWGLTEQERSYLGVSLVRQAGHLLATAWAENEVMTLSNIKEMPKESRRELLLTGYPLTTVIEAFENSYQGLEISTVGALRAMSPMREKASAPQNNSNGPVYG